METKHKERKGGLPTSIRLSETCKQLWEDTAAALGLNLSATVEVAIRKLAKAEGIDERSSGTARALMALPLERRRAALAASVESVARYYDEETTMPMDDRELTAFTALDTDPIQDDYLPEVVGGE